MRKGPDVDVELSAGSSSSLSLSDSLGSAGSCWRHLSLRVGCSDIWEFPKFEDLNIDPKMVGLLL